LIGALNRSLITTSLDPSELEPERPAVPAGSRPAGPLRLRGGAESIAGPRLRGRPASALSITRAGAYATARVTIDTERSFTVSAWLEPAASGETGTAVSEPGPDGSSFSLGIETAAGRSTRPVTHWTLIVPAASNCTSAHCGVRANMRYDDGRDPPQQRRWYMVTGVYDIATASIALYVDGVPEDLEHVFAVPLAAGPLTVGVGSGDYEPADWFRGAIAGLLTWGRALTPGEVWQLYRYESR
jgi:hypothetical protein